MMVGGAGLDTGRYLRELDNGKQKFVSFQDLINSVKDCHQRRVVAEMAESKTDDGQPGNNTGNGGKAKSAEHIARDNGRRTLLAYMGSPACKIFSEAREVKALGSDLDRLVFEGGSLPEAISLLQELDQEGKKYRSVPDVIGAIREARARRVQQHYIADQNRRALYAYLSSARDCSLFTAARSDVKATASDLDALINEGGGLEETMTLLRALDQAGRKFGSFPDLLPALKDGRTEVIHIATLPHSHRSNHAHLDISYLVMFCDVSSWKRKRTLQQVRTIVVQ
jgi:hypothetical protein